MKFEYWMWIYFRKPYYVDKYILRQNFEFQHPQFDRLRNKRVRATLFFSSFVIKSIWHFDRILVKPPSGSISSQVFSSSRIFSLFPKSSWPLSFEGTLISLKSFPSSRSLIFMQLLGFSMICIQFQLCLKFELQKVTFQLWPNDLTSFFAVA